MGRSLFRIYLYEVAVDGVATLRITRLALHRLAIGEALNLHLATQVFVHGGTDGRDQQGKADGIGKEARRQKQRPRKQDHRTTGEVFARITQIVEGLTEAQQFLSALTLHKIGTEDSGQQHDEQRRPQPDKTANVDEKCDFDQRNRDKCQQ